MNKKEIEQLIKVVKKQIQLAMLYPEEWIARYGQKGFEDWIDERLDYLNYLREEYKKFD